MYEQGFRGYTMMNGAGTGMLIPYSHVGMAHDSVLPVVGWESTERLECNCVREIGLDNKHGCSIEAMHSFPLPVNLDTKLSVRPQTNRKSRPARRARQGARTVRGAPRGNKTPL